MKYDHREREDEEVAREVPQLALEVEGGEVLAAVGGTYLVATGFAFWPRERQAKGELYDREEEGEWKNG